MPQTLNVEQEELLARAAELERALPTPPLENPRAACALPMVLAATNQLALSADSMRLYLRAGEREFRRLAESLRNAAKAYEEVDEEAADAVTDNSSVSARTLLAADPDEDLVLPSAAPAPAAMKVPYYEVRQAATDIEAPDQGVSFTAMSRTWDSYQRTLQGATYRFRPFSQWEGASATVVEANFEAQRTWVYQMAQLCSQLASQASTAAAAHKWAITEHPSAYQIALLDSSYEYWTGPGASNPNARQYVWQVLDAYDIQQKKSEEVLADYARRAAFPLMPVNPKAPPTATRIEPPPSPPKPGEGDDADLPDDTYPDPGLPAGGGGIPQVPTVPSAGTPSLPPTGVPPVPGTSALTDAMKNKAAAAAAAAGVGAGMKPASLGGAGGGGGVPSMPLQPAVTPESATGAGPGAGRDVGNLARAVGGATPGGAGGMGMAPMGAPGAGAGQGGEGKGKRAQGTEESLYSEERPWTEGVIGNRRRKDVSDSKDAK